MSKIFAVMGATGNIGHMIVETLLKRGHTVRVFGRDKKKLNQMIIKGAQPFIGNLDDINLLTDGFKDAYAIFSMIPPSHQETNYGEFQNHISQAICRAIQNANTDRVVNLSSMGANLAEGTGPIKGLHRHEKRLDELKRFSQLVHLRPTYFMENLNNYFPMMQHEGIFSSSIDENLPIPMIATRDIGMKAADILDGTAPQPNLIFEIEGPKNVTMNNVAGVFGKAFNKPNLRYEKISQEQEKKQMLSIGMPKQTVEMMLEMFKAFNDGWIKPTQELKPFQYGTTTLEEYAQILLEKKEASTHI